MYVKAWRLNNILLKAERVIEEIFKILEANEDDSTTYHMYGIQQKQC